MVEKKIIQVLMEQLTRELRQAGPRRYISEEPQVISAKDAGPVGSANFSAKDPDPPRQVDTGHGSRI